MDATLSIHDSRMAEEDLQELTSALLRSINQETDLTAKLPEERGGAGTKGDPVTVGSLLLAALSSGTVVAMFQVLKSYIERKPTLKIELQAADGRTLKIEAEHLSKTQMEQTIQTARQFCGV
ncbi:effector-associated constant component EACC1 [Candidatus Electronema sp. PJ]|uniref:effector-associated constant component EACC1 n=1 Tax=Candidatus Electronema sp. PJ TaxID=3401572 RepID=UPI003AA85738